MRIELTLPALERLIAGDSEIETGLRRQIVEEFAKRHLKTLLNDEAFKAISTTWHAEIRAAVAQTVKQLRDEKQAKVESGEAGKSALTWQWDLKEAVEKAAAEAVEAAIQASAARWTDNIDRTVLRRVQNQIGECVDAELAKRVKDRASPLGSLIEEEVEARISERLSAARNLGRSIPQTA